MTEEKKPEPTPYAYEPIPGGKVKRLADGVELAFSAREVREARAAGTVAPGKTARSKDTGAQAPQKVKPPREISTKKPQTKKERAVELGMLIGFVFDGVALVRGAFWALTDEERSRMASAASAIMPQMPARMAKQIENVAPWVNLVMVSQAIVLPRIAADLAFQARLREEQRQKNQQQAKPHAVPNVAPQETPQNGRSYGEHVVKVAPVIPGANGA